MFDMKDAPVKRECRSNANGSRRASLAVDETVNAARRQRRTAGAAIEAAKTSVEILIFRFDRGEMERALIAAAKRGVFVHALIAYTNRGGEKNLRDLEMRLLAAGVTVARHADNLIRYHGKMLIVDRSVLYLLGFNFTYIDIEHSRSSGSGEESAYYP